MEKIIVFTRQEGFRIETVAILKVTLDKDIPDAKVMEEYKRLVTMWARDTKNGKELLVYSGGDVNIGDISCYDAEFSKFLKCLSKKNRGHILKASIVFSGEVQDAIPFDTLLVNIPKED